MSNLYIDYMNLRSVCWSLQATTLTSLCPIIPSRWSDSKVTVRVRTGSSAFLGEMLKVVTASPPGATELHIGMGVVCVFVLCVCLCVHMCVCVVYGVCMLEWLLHKVKNEDILADTGEVPVEAQPKPRQLQWFGYLQRMPEYRLQLKCRSQGKNKPW